jgi:hypothetical protein
MQTPNFQRYSISLPLSCLFFLFCTPQPDSGDLQKVEILPFVQNASDSNSQLYSDIESFQNKTENLQPGKADSAKASFFIFYGDTASYNPLTEIPEGTCTGIRVPVQIRASINGLDTLSEYNNEFAIEMNAPMLVAYKSDSVTDTIPIASARLVNGVSKIYIKNKEGYVRNCMITVSNLDSSKSVMAATRTGINFTTCNTSVRVDE